MSTLESPRPNKRKRDEESEDPSSADAPNLVAPVRSPDIWYDDGNVILEAEGTQYKVYRGILVKSSSVFQDMFSFPQPPASDAEMIEGCPVVRLSDSAEEVQYVLQALFELKYITSGEEMPLPVLAALLCLGKKYDFRKLHIEARRRIFEIFPITLKGHDAVPAEWHGLMSVDEDTYFNLLLIAKRTGLVSILPQVLYECHDNYSASEIVNGFELEDRTKSVGHFSCEDGRTLLAGNEAIRDATVITTYKWLYGPGNLYSSCKTPKRCHRTRQDAHIILSKTGAAVPSPLDEWGWPSMYMNDGLCEDCAKLAQGEHQAGREKFWELLPSIYGLPPWSELSKEREEIE